MTSETLALWPGQGALFATPAEQALDRLAAYWDEANRRWFGGEMKPVPIIAGLERAKRTLGRTGYDWRAGRYEIHLRKSLVDRLDPEANPGRYLRTTDVLLHEMIHQYLFFARVREPDHGPEFTAWCNKIGSVL